MSGNQIKFLLRAIFIIGMIASGNVFACLSDNGTNFFSEDNTFVYTVALEKGSKSLIKAETTSTSSSVTSHHNSSKKSDHSKATEKHPTHNDCKCCDFCQCANCNGCTGQTLPVIKTLLTDNWYGIISTCRVAQPVTIYESISSVPLVPPP